MLVITAVTLTSTCFNVRAYMSILNCILTRDQVLQPQSTGTSMHKIFKLVLEYTTNRPTVIYS